jgi:hypothetical protein
MIYLFENEKIKEVTEGILVATDHNFRILAELSNFVFNMRFFAAE